MKSGTAEVPRVAERAAVLPEEQGLESPGDVGSWIPSWQATGGLQVSSEDTPLNSKGLKPLYTACRMNAC